MGEMRDHTVWMVGHVGTARAALLRTRREHEVLHYKLVAAVEQIGQPLSAPRPLEDVLFVYLNPGQLPTQLRNLITAPRQILLGGQEIAPHFEPLLARYRHMCRHWMSPFMGRRLPDADREIDLSPGAGGSGVTSVSGFA